MPAENEQEKSPINQQISTFVSVIFEWQSYLNLLYLLLAFVLGTVYFTIFTFAFAFGIALSIFLIGIPILFAAVIGSRFVAGFERALANSLLDTDISGGEQLHTADLWSAVVAYTTAESTWRGLGFLGLKFWVGLISGILVLVGLAVTFALITAPLGGETVVLNYPIDSTVESILAVPVGILFGIAFLHVSNAAATLSAVIAVALLDESPDDDRVTHATVDGNTRVTNETGEGGVEADVENSDNDKGTAEGSISSDEAKQSNLL